VGNEGTIDDQNVIRIGTTGSQLTTGIAGIADTMLTAGSVVGVASDGQLGVLPSTLLPPGPGPMPGSLLFLSSTVPPPEGYVLLGDMDLMLKVVEGGKPTKLTIHIYQKV